MGKSAHVGKSALCGETCDFCGGQKINHVPLLVHVVVVAGREHREDRDTLGLKEEEREGGR